MSKARHLRDCLVGFAANFGTKRTEGRQKSEGL